MQYINNIVQQDHRAMEVITKSMRGYTSFHAAKNVLAGLESMHLIRKAQLKFVAAEEMSSTDQVYAMAGEISPV